MKDLMKIDTDFLDDVKPLKDLEILKLVEYCQEFSLMDHEKEALKTHSERLCHYLTASAVIILNLKRIARRRLEVIVEVSSKLQETRKEVERLRIAAERSGHTNSSEELNV